jgi:hypothetical protein
MNLLKKIIIDLIDLRQNHFRVLKVALFDAVQIILNVIFAALIFSVTDGNYS